MMNTKSDFKEKIDQLNRSLFSSLVWRIDKMEGRSDRELAVAFFGEYQIVMQGGDPGKLSVLWCFKESCRLLKTDVISAEEGRLIAEKDYQAACLGSIKASAK